MISRKQGLRVCALGVVLLSAVGTAAFAQSNTAYGIGALQNNQTGDLNDSAFGFNALSSTTGSSGIDNTASGAYTLEYNTTGTWNTASGVAALLFNTIGAWNTASGGYALNNNIDGYYNTATGAQALQANGSGYYNTATGAQALLNNNGSYNTASGYYALYGNTTGLNNTATGVQSLSTNSTGDGNVADGYQALEYNLSGYRNTAEGTGALTNTNGNYNIAVGFRAGYTISGSNNIEIGSMGDHADANTTRLGTQGTQRATYIAGIFGTAMTGADVVVSSTGRLGVLPSSARYKSDIQPLDQLSNKLWQLHPVTFRYKQDPSQRQYGLIAEQVAKVYPELVVRGDKGEVESVQYRELIPLMLNEMQHQQATLTALKAQNDVLRATLAQQNAVFAARLDRLERTSAKTLASR